MDFLVPITKGKVHIVGYRYKIRVHDSGCRLLNVKLTDTQFWICCVEQVDKKSQITVKKINTLLGTVMRQIRNQFSTTSKSILDTEWKIHTFNTVRSIHDRVGRRQKLYLSDTQQANFGNETLLFFLVVKLLPNIFFLLHETVF
jgi:hypothetical protein